MTFPTGRQDPLGYSWDGAHLRPTGLTLESQLHELSHLLVAPVERRGAIEFGLGPDPYRRSSPPRLVESVVADREELDACALQIGLAEFFQLDAFAVSVEFSTEPLTAAALGRLQARCRHALPTEWWRALQAHFASPHLARHT
ncbi:MAG: hypothetical protein AAGF12_23245 [Myxococcota bacterium]